VHTRASHLILSSETIVGESSPINRDQREPKILWIQSFRKCRDRISFIMNSDVFSRIFSRYNCDNVSRFIIGFRRMTAWLAFRTTTEHDPSHFPFCLICVRYSFLSLSFSLFFFFKSKNASRASPWTFSFVNVDRAEQTAHRRKSIIFINITNNCG
jgi:hypothetical protein